MAKTVQEQTQARWDANVVTHREWVTNQPWEGKDSGEEIVGLLKEQGLKASHSILDVGCGSLRVGRWLIQAQRKGRYFGIEPNLWLVYMGLEEELPEGVFEKKEPTFSDNSVFDAGIFNQQFDYVLICHVFTHGGDKQIGMALWAAAKALAPGGAILCDLFTAGPHYEGDEWRYPQISCHSQACLEHVAKRVGLTCAHIGSVGVTHWFRLEKV